MLKDPVLCIEQQGLLSDTLRAVFLVSLTRVIFLRHYVLFIFDCINTQSFYAVNRLNDCDLSSWFIISL